VAADDAELDDECDDDLDDGELFAGLIATTPGSSLTSRLNLRGLSHHSWSRRVSSDHRILYLFLPFFLGFLVTSMFHSQSESRWSWPRVLQPSQVVGFFRGVGPYSGRCL
jgi:hypothetical protein